MLRARLWAVRHSRWLERFYRGFEKCFVAAHPLWSRIGYARLDRPVAEVERIVKGALFDCRMCGQCTLSSSGMSCPMNCPKNLRNGPCGGVRANGNCEVKPDMRCVWVLAWQGSQQMSGGAQISQIQKPIDFRLQNRSSWLRVARDQRRPTRTTKTPDQ